MLTGRNEQGQSKSIVFVEREESWEFQEHNAVSFQQSQLFIHHSFLTTEIYTR